MATAAPKFDIDDRTGERPREPPLHSPAPARGIPPPQKRIQLVQRSRLSRSAGVQQLVPDAESEPRPDQVCAPPLPG